MAKLTLELFAIGALSTQCYGLNGFLQPIFKDGLYLPVLFSLANSVVADTTSSVSFKPTAGATWNIQLSPVPEASQAHGYHIWDFDMAEAPKSTIDAFHAKGHPVICYFSAGTKESYRKDADEFPKDAVGKVDKGWPQERWVDVRNAGVREIMKQRIAKAQSKGCDGIDPDNIDGYENDTGFDLTKDDAVDYIHFLAKHAHDRGMAFGLKNGGAIVDRVIDVSQWVIIEQCVRYNECKEYRPFIENNKPVFQIEYSSVSKGCNKPNTGGFSTLIKHLSLDGWTRTCP